MAHKFHKLRTESEFPYLDNQNVYQFDNDFDYQRYNATQMKITLCTVPWDMGEAHIGARTISGIGNVVHFGTKEKRDAWFDAIPDSECFRFKTKYKELHRNQTIDVPVPFDVAAKYNYLVVEYSLFANDDSLVEYETSDGMRKWFWFIREVEFIAPNNTRLHILDDAFQTWIYDVNISGMLLERGHAPMFSTKADAFLSNPLENNTYLLTEDVNFGSVEQVKHIDALALNAGDMYACIATTANPTANWGTKAADTWHTPASAYYMNDGVPSVYVFAIEVSDLDDLLSNITSSYPQFKQTIQGVFFASADLLTLGSAFEFADVTCYRVSASRKTFDLCELSKSLFGYDSKYRNIAKLYTSPYAHIEITDESGNVDVVKIEDTTGNINVSVALSIAYPFVNIESHLLGTGGNASASITYRNVSSKTFPVSGQWYETLRTWKVPTFAVVLDASREYDYSTHFDRNQRVVDYTTAYDNASASASTEKANADAMADTTHTNAYNSANTAHTNAYNSANATHTNAYTAANAGKTTADNSANNLVTNAGVQATANSSITTESNSRANSDVSLSNALNQGLQAWEAGYARDTVNNEVNAEYASATIGAAGGLAQGAASGIGGGPAGIVAGLISGAISGVTSAAQTAVAANLKSTQAEATINLSQAKVTDTNLNSSQRTSNQNLANTHNTNTANTALTTTAANNAATTKENATTTQTAEKSIADTTQAADKDNADNTQTTDKGNADRTQTTQKANNQRTYNTAIANAGRSRTQAQSAIDNDIKQAALRAPFIYGAFADGDNATTKPMALFANIVTQSKSAIASAGDEFLRYGYMLEKQWDFSTWHYGKYFTYWKLRDFWVSNLNVPDMYMDMLRFFLFGGVTVWRRPEDIGKVTVYDNFN